MAAAAAGLSTAPMEGENININIIMSFVRKFVCISIKIASTWVCAYLLHAAF